MKNIALAEGAAVRNRFPARRPFAVAFSGAVLALSFFLAGCAAREPGPEASGTFESPEIIVSSEATGRILSFDAEEGSRISEGMAVARIDSVQLELKRKQLESQIRGAENRKPDIALQLAATEQQLETARGEKERIERLLSAEAASRKQLDDAVAQIATLERQLAAQRESLDSSRASLGDEQSALGYQIAQLDDQIARCVAKSPVDGTLIVKYAEAGELATPGKALFRVANLDRMYLRAYVDADIVTAVKLGSAATVYADYGTKAVREYRGTVSWISDKAEFTPKNAQTRNERSNLVYAAKIAVDNDGFLKLGMYGAVRFSHE